MELSCGSPQKCIIMGGSFKKLFKTFYFELFVWLSVAGRTWTQVLMEASRGSWDPLELEF